MATTLTSPAGEITFGKGLPILLINDQLRVMDQKPIILEQLQAGNLEGLIALAHEGHQKGTDMVDILVNYPGIDEVELLPRIANRVIREVGCPVSLDTRNPDALEATLKAIHPYKALINSISAESEVMNSLLPLVHKYNAAFIAMPMGYASHLPMTCRERLEEARVIIDAAAGIGIPKEDIVLDAICLAAASGPGTFDVTMETLNAFHDVLDTTTILGIGNAGYGMPEQTVIDLAYLVGAIPNGLDSALVDPNTRGLIETVRAMDFLSNRDPIGKRYIQQYRNRKKNSSST